MKLSAYIKYLTTLQEMHGDLDVVNNAHGYNEYREIIVMPRARTLKKCNNYLVATTRKEVNLAEPHKHYVKVITL